MDLSSMPGKGGVHLIPHIPPESPMFKPALAAALVVAAISAPVHALTAGDVAFTSFNAEEDGWSLVLLTNVAFGVSSRATPPR